jgi:hypothetical protein
MPTRCDHQDAFMAVCKEMESRLSLRDRQVLEPSAPPAPPAPPTERLLGTLNIPSGTT